MRVEVSTTRYEFSHGKKPSGPGFWAFEFPGSADPWFARESNTYAQAKREAMAEAKRRGVDCIWVAP